MPKTDAVRKFEAELPVEEAFEPAQYALARVAAKWLKLLTPEERKVVRGIMVEIDEVDPPGSPDDVIVPTRVTLLRRGPPGEAP
jgi:hypothetical protein